MKYDLVFEGGGAKGMVFVGACQEFFQRGHTFGRLLGTSAGAITATLLAAGYTPQEMLETFSEKQDGKSVFEAFMGMPPPFADEEILGGATRRLLDGIDFRFLTQAWENKLYDRLAKSLAASPRFRHLVALIERGGWYSADRFVAWLQSKLDSGMWQGRQRAFSKMTLKDFFQATNTELSVVASDTTDEKLLVVNHQTAPDCPVVWAVRMSMSIPLLWDEVQWQKSWGAYRGRDITDHIVVDGGLLSNFPIELFISDQPQFVKLMGAKLDNPVLGLLIDEQLPVEPAEKGIFVTVNIKPGELTTVKRLERLVNTATGAHDKMVLDEYSHLVVRLPAAGYGTTEFGMSDERRDALVQAGREAMAKYFDSIAAPEIMSKGLEPEARLSAADRIAARILQ